MAFNLIGCNFNQSSVDRQYRVIPAWADIFIRDNLGYEVMRKPGARNFPLGFASVE